MSAQVELGCRAADRGNFDTAVGVCALVAADSREYAACRSLIASVYRQVGRHDLAQCYDGQGLSCRPDDPVGAAMCALGLAADRVGGGDLDGALRALREAEDVLARVPASHWAARWFDPWITHAWVQAEVSLMADRPEDAVAVLEPFARVRPRATHGVRWAHERAKTWLFLGVAQRCAGRPDDAVDSLERAVRIAAQAGLRPLLVPAEEQLRLLDPQRAAPWSGAARAAAAELHRHAPPPG